MLQTLPPEIINMILDAIPTREGSIRPANGLYPLLSICRRLLPLIDHRLHHHIQLRTTAQIDRYLDVYSRVGFMVKVLTLYPPSLSARAVWPHDVLARLLRTTLTPEHPLAELRISRAGVDSERLIYDAQSPFSVSSLLGLVTLSIDFGPPATLREDDLRDEDIDTTESFALPSLRSLRLCGLVSSSRFMSHLGFWPSSALRHLELDRSHLSDEQMTWVLRGVRMRSLSLKKCTGFSRDTLIACVRLIGARLERFELEIMSAQEDHPSPPLSPQRLPLSPPRSPTIPPQKYHPLINVLDELIPHTTGLRQLVLVGPLASTCFPLLLAASAKRLHSLSITSCPTLSAHSLYPLLSSNSPYLLPNLSSLFLDHPSSALEDTRAAQEVFGMASMRLDGSVFDRVRHQMNWAVESSQAIGEALLKTTPRKKRRPAEVGVRL